MTLAEFALEHRRGLLFASVAAMLAGLAAAPGLPKAVYPEVTFPREQVVAEVEGASAETVMAGVTRPLEAAMGAIPGIRTIRSQTIRGATEVSLFFEPGANMAEVHSLVAARVAELRSQLPAGTEVTASRVLPSGFPILSINIEGPLPPQRLYELAEYTLRPALASLEGAGPVTVQSSDIPELQVELDLARLQAAHLTVPDVADRLRQANAVATFARLERAHELVLGVASGGLRTADDVAAVVVGGTPSAPVRIADLGSVHEGVAPHTSLIRVDGQPGVIINIPRQPSGDILALDAEVRAKLEELRPSLPSGVKLVPTYEQAVFVDSAVRGVRDAVLFGALFAVIVLALFLRDLRATLIAALSLPLTLGSALLVLKALGQTLNLMTLGGLAVSVGLVIDDAVVVIEAVHRLLEEGLAPEEAARRGTQELLWPIIGTTATTVIVFLPLALLSGVAGQFFISLSVALAAAVIISLPVALLVLPGICARFLRPVTRRPGSRLETAYASALEKVLQRRWVVLVAGLVLFAGAYVAAQHLASDFLPEADEGAYVIDYFAPVGASMADADRLASEIEAVVRETPEVASFSRRLGAELGPPTATLTSRGDVAVRLKDHREREIDEIMEAQRAALATRLPGVRVEFIQVLSDMLGDLEGSPEPIELKLFGPDPSTLRELAHQAEERIKGVPGLVDFFGGDDGCAPELDLQVDSFNAARQGLNAQSVGDQLSAIYLGEVATQLRRPDRLLDIRVLARTHDVTSPGELPLVGSGGDVIPAGILSQATRSCPPAVSLREGQRNMVHLTARLENTDLGTAAAAIRERLAGWKLPPGYVWELGGLVQQQRESFRSLLSALLVALFSVTAILLFQLSTTRRTLAILAAVPFALAAAVLTLAVTRMALNVSSLMGAIVLVGLVVKNGILLLDYAAESERRGVPLARAVRDAARVRLRPILMTTLATLAALVPLALGIGAGADLHRPLAIVVLGGLAFSTLATLFVVPLIALGSRGERANDITPPSP